MPLRDFRQPDSIISDSTEGRVFRGNVRVLSSDCPMGYNKFHTNMDIWLEASKII